MALINTADRIYVGAELASAIYLGENKVWPQTIWTPAELYANSEMGVFFDLSDNTTMYQDLARTIPVTQLGDPVKSVTDLSGNNLHLRTESTAGSYDPEFSMYGMTDRTGMLFPGTDYYAMHCDYKDVPATTSFTHCIAWRTTKREDRTTGGIVWGTRTSAPTYYIQGRGTSLSAWRMNYRNTLLTATLTAEDPLITNVAVDATSNQYILRENAQEFAPRAYTPASASTANHSMGRLGATYYGEDTFVFAVVAINRLLTTEETELLEAWIAEKAGITLGV